MNEIQSSQLEAEAAEYSTEHPVEMTEAEAQYLDYLEAETEAVKQAEALRRAAAESRRNRFLSIKELFNRHDKPLEWLVRHVLPNESLISLQGRPKCGKSTLVFAMLKALLEGGEFLGSSLRPIKVVYLSEQNRISMCQQLKEAGIDTNMENMTVMSVEETFPTWQENFEAAKKQLAKTGAELLVVDSWGKFAGFGPHEDEYQSGPTLLRVNKLRELISITGSSVLIIHHTGKQPGRSLIDAGLGATVLAAQVDQAFSLSGEPKQPAASSSDMQNERCRSLQSVGRFTEAFRDIQIERIDDGTYRTVFEPDHESAAPVEVIPPTEEILKRVFAAHPELRAYGNQKLSKVLKQQQHITLSERKIAGCREKHPELRHD
jgi:hypothetical protein